MVMMSDGEKRANEGGGKITDLLSRTRNEVRVRVDPFCRYSGFLVGIHEYIEHTLKERSG
jgi:hypothetical protein